jgi:hypothetical protein
MVIPLAKRTGSVIEPHAHLVGSVEEPATASEAELTHRAAAREGWGYAQV